MADTMNVTNRLQEAGNQAAQAASQAAANAGEQIIEAACAASKDVSQMGAYLDSKAEEATSAVGSRLKSAGDAVRENGPQSGPLGQASAAVADKLTETGEYLQREGLHGIGHDLTTVIKKNPVSAMLVGIGLGVLLARASTPRT